MRFELDEAAARFESLLYLATHGEDIILTQHGRPVARLVPFDADSAFVYDALSRRRCPSLGLIGAGLAAGAAIVAAAACCQWRRQTRR